MIHATARDWAKFGEFLRLQGSVQGVRVVPSDWVHFMTTPSPRNPAYGAQLWLNRTQDNGKIELFPSRGPRSLFAAIGHGGQYVIVSPDQQLTIVRLGKTSDAQRPALVARLADIAVLFGGGRGRGLECEGHRPRAPFVSSLRIGFGQRARHAAPPA
jgi:CubicO group peptidase (beta-lactamase class C family)